MTPNEIADARRQLGLGQEDLARLLGYGAAARISELENVSPITGAPKRIPSDTVLRLLQAYLDGYRPADWPAPKPKKGNTDAT